MADLILYQSADGGELVYEAGDLVLDHTPFTAIFLSLWGGNLEDDGSEATKAAQWWGNLDEPDETRKLRSRTQALLLRLPAITANLLLVEEAAEQDLAWLTEEIADSVTVTASLPARNRVRLLVEVLGRDGTPYTFDFQRTWGPSQ